MYGFVRKVQKYGDAFSKSNSICCYWSSVAKYQTHSSFIVVLNSCKNDEDPSKNESTRVLTTFLHYRPRDIFSNVQGQLTL